MKLKDRVDKTFQRYGEALLVNRKVPVRGFLQHVDGTQIAAYFGDEASVRLGMIALIPADVAVSSDDRITCRDRTYIVSRMCERRVRDMVVMQMALLR